MEFYKGKSWFVHKIFLFIHLIFPERATKIYISTRGE